MLHDLDTLTGSSVIATDGEMGSIRNFLFDDQSWTIRYLVVDVGSWLTRRAVVLAITAVEQPDWVKKTFHVHLTKEQVRNSPDVDTEKPVSRQQEIAMQEYFGWPIYWADSELGPVSSLRPAGNTRCTPRRTRISAVPGTWRVTKCGPRTVKSGAWRASSWTTPPGISATWM